MDNVYYSHDGRRIYTEEESMLWLEYIPELTGRSNLISEMRTNLKIRNLIFRTVRLMENCSNIDFSDRTLLLDLIYKAMLNTAESYHHDLVKYHDPMSANQLISVIKNIHKNMMINIAGNKAMLNHFSEYDFVRNYSNRSY